MLTSRKRRTKNRKMKGAVRKKREKNNLIPSSCFLFLIKRERGRQNWGAEEVARTGKVTVFLEEQVAYQTSSANRGEAGTSSPGEATHESEKGSPEKKKK